MTTFKKIDGSKLTDIELIAQSLSFGYKIHKMNRIPILDILNRIYLISDDRKDFIVSTIVKHNIANFADIHQNDLLITIDGIKAINTDNPISFMEKLKDPKNNQSITIHGHAIIGDNNQNNTQESFERLDIASKNDIKQIPIETPKPKSNHDIWDKLKSIGQILGFGAALLALITKLMDLW